MHHLSGDAVYVPHVAVSQQNRLSVTASTRAIRATARIFSPFFPHGIHAAFESI